MDGFKQIGKYAKTTQKQTNFSLKRPFVPSVSVEKIRDVFDPQYPFLGQIKTPDNAETVSLSLNFGKKLPALGCCGDCFCGTTESYTSDSLIGSNIYTQQEYVPNSTVVYLDGVPAIRNTDYVESSPTSKQLSIITPFSLVTISYVYTVGNCSGPQECIDDFTCPEFRLFSPLATVFADRFDTPTIGGETSGGCGVWATSINTATGIPVQSEVLRGAGIAAIGADFACLGGMARVAGKTIEIVAALGPGSDASFSPTNQEYAVSMNYAAITATTIRFTLHGWARYYVQPFPDEPTFITTADDSFTKQVDFTVPAEFISTSKMVRAAQYPQGDLYIGVWEEGTDESLGYSATLTLGDWTPPTMTGDDTLLGYEQIVPTVYAVLTTAELRAIKIGTGLDTGDWMGQDNVSSGGKGAYLEVCRSLPDYAPGIPYFGDCSSESISAVLTSDFNAEYQAQVSFPVVIGDEPPDGSGKIANLNQTVGSIDCLPGRPSAIRVKGKVYATFAIDTTVSIEFASYPGDTVPAYNSSQFAGSTIGSMLLSTNADPVPFDFVVPASDGVARWGVHIPQIDVFAAAQPFIPGAFLFGPLHHITISFTQVEWEALANVECQAGNICGLCFNERCSDTTDGFYEDNFSTFSAPGFREFNRLTQSGQTMTVEQGDGTAFSSNNGEGTITFPGAAIEGFSTIDFKYPLGLFQCRTKLDQNIEAYFDFKINTFTPTNGYSEISWGGWDDGVQAWIQIWDGAVQASFMNGGGSTTMPVSISPNVWYTAGYKTEGTDVLAGVGADAGSISWTRLEDAVVESDGLLFNTPSTFYFSGGDDMDPNPSTTEISFRNVSIRSI